LLEQRFIARMLLLRVIVHSDQAEDAGFLLAGVMYTIPIPFKHKTNGKM